MIILFIWYLSFQCLSHSICISIFISLNFISFYLWLRLMRNIRIRFIRNINTSHFQHHINSITLFILNILIMSPFIWRNNTLLCIYHSNSITLWIFRYLTIMSPFLWYIIYLIFSKTHCNCDSLIILKRWRVNPFRWRYYTIYR